jgi:hypothetical protein
MADIEQVTYNGPDGATMGKDANEKISFYGVTPIVQRTAAVATSDVGTATSTDVTTAVKAAILDIMATLKAIGIYK